MSCGKCTNPETHKAWNKAMAIGGGVVIGVAAVGAIIAAPVEIAITVAAVGVTKWALKKHNEHTHEHEEAETTVTPSTEE